MQYARVKRIVTIETLVPVENYAGVLEQMSEEAVRKYETGMGWEDAVEHFASQMQDAVFDDPKHEALHLLPKGTIVTEVTFE